MKETEPHPSDTDQITRLIILKKHNNNETLNIAHPLWCIGTYVNNKLKLTT